MQSTSADVSSESEVGSHAQSDQDLRQPMDELRERLQAANERVKGFIKDRPVTCLVGAMALGYVIARIARRRS